MKKITELLVWSHLLLIVESCLISLVATFLLKPSLNATFDLHKHQSVKQLDEEKGGSVAMQSAGHVGNVSIFRSNASPNHDYDDFSISETEEEPPKMESTSHQPKLAFSL